MQLPQDLLHVFHQQGRCPVVTPQNMLPIKKKTIKKVSASFKNGTLTKSQTSLAICLFCLSIPLARQTPEKNRSRLGVVGIRGHRGPLHGLQDRQGVLAARQLHGKEMLRHLGYRCLDVKMLQFCVKMKHRFKKMSELSPCFKKHLYRQMEKKEVVTIGSLFLTSWLFYFCWTTKFCSCFPHLGIVILATTQGISIGRSRMLLAAWSEALGHLVWVMTICSHTSSRLQRLEHDTLLDIWLSMW